MATTTYRVYYEDTDAGGVVYYANYLKFAERARTDLLRSKEVSQSRLLNDEKVAFVVRRAEVDFIRPARLDDLLTIETSITSIGGASLQMSQRIFNDEHILLCEVHTKIGFIDTQTFRPARFPETLKKLFAAVGNA